MRYNATKAEKKEIVDETIKSMKLEAARNTLIGGNLIKGVSGGEKKRTNIAFELISNPQILFLDEPTSGLDSFTSYIIVSQLQKFAKEKNKTIVYTIHQPNSDIFKLFDK